MKKHCQSPILHRPSVKWCGGKLSIRPRVGGAVKCVLLV